ncbi:MAG: pantetheine-phosphate adenylyltransferase [Bacteroidetes bacterium]|nr:pantetheine-phosphate adenylyltransferase [Bacteroidota bacterium]
MERIAVFPGSFDPVTKGHESVVLRALPLFEKIIIAIGENSGKSSLFSLTQRMTWIKEVFQNHPGVEVSHYSGLTVDFCTQQKARYLIRGLRSQADFDFERTIALMNREMHPEIETVFLLAEPAFSAINSSIVREIYKNGGDIRPFIPDSMTL